MIIFGSPRRYLQGPGAIAQLGEEVAKLGRSALLLADDHVLGLIGESVGAGCRAAGVGFTAVRFGGEITEPRSTGWRPRRAMCDRTW